MIQQVGVAILQTSVLEVNDMFLRSDEHSYLINLNNISNLHVVDNMIKADDMRTSWLVGIYNSPERAKEVFTDIANHFDSTATMYTMYIVPED